MRAFRIISFVSCLLPAALLGQTTLYWDTDGPTPGVAQAAGSWNAAHWSTSASGEVATGSWVDGSIARFGGSLGTTYLSVDSAVTIAGIHAEQYRSVDISGSGTLTFAPGTYLFNDSSLLISASIAGSATPGTVAFSNSLVSYPIYLSGANTFTGQAVFNHGDISINHLQALGATGTGNETVISADYSGNFFHLGASGIYNEGFIIASSPYFSPDDADVTLAGPIMLQGGGSKGIWGEFNITGNIGESGGASTFVASGTTLSGANTFTGPLQVGDVTIATFGTTGAAGPLGMSDTVQLGYYYESAVGGTIHYTGTGQTESSDRKIALYGDRNTIDVVGNSTVLTLTGQIARSTASQADTSPDFVKEGPGTLILRGDNTYNGDTFVTNGLLIAGHDHAFGTDSESELEIGTWDTATGDNLGVLLEDGITLDKYIDVYNQNYEGATTLGLVNTGSATFGEEIYLQRDIDVKVNSGGLLTFEGMISDGVSGGGLKKIGGGTAVFNNAIDLRVGGLVIDAGKVVLAAPNSVDLAGGLTINSGGSLGFASATGTLTVPSLAIDGGNLVWRLGDLTTNTLHDRFEVESPEMQGFSAMSNLSIAEGSTLTVDLSLLGISSRPSSSDRLTNAPFWQSEQVWTLIAFSGGGTNDLVPGSYNPLLVTNAGEWAGGKFDTFVGGGSGAWAAFTAGDVFLRFTPVPEPSTWALLGLGSLMAGFLRWRRRA